MQREARRVQKENSILRALLYKQGFDDMAIQEAVVIAERAEGSETPLPAFHRSPEHLIATGIDLALPETQHHIQNHIGPNAPQICPQGLPQALTFEGNAAPLEVQANIPQELNFNDWLMDLCNIKDAFGIDIFVCP
jgi:hypothetical protein